MSGRIRGFFVLAGIVWALLGGIPCDSWAKDPFPTKPVMVINPYAAGGTGDREIRALAPHLQKHLNNTPVVVQNVTGAGGRIALAKVFGEAPDGYSLAYINMPAANLGELLYSGKYKTLEFSYLFNLVKEYRVLAVKADSPLKSWKDAVEAARTKVPTNAVSGLGTSGHMACVLLEKAGLKNKPIPFEGSGPSRAAFLGGHVDLWVPDASDAEKLMKDKMIRVLAVLAPKRLPEFPDAPTVKELGSEAEVFTSRGFVAAPKVPKEVQGILIQAMEKAAQEAEFQAWARKMGVSLLPLKGEEFAGLAQEIHKQSLSVLPAMEEATKKK